MSADRIDVLAVMASTEDFIARVCGDDVGSNARDLAEARAAVAELIAADAEYDAAAHDLATQRRQVGAIESAEARFNTARARRAAALARVGGAA